MPFVAITHFVVIGAVQRSALTGVKAFKQTDAAQNLEAFGLGQFVQRNEWLALPTTKK